ncbi:MAG: hypothetical protein KFF77_09475 [Bacteroidetes bacterium]|nr:hypothetical protein [Bacteroidota bacterium]
MRFRLPAFHRFLFPAILFSALVFPAAGVTAADSTLLAVEPVFIRFFSHGGEAKLLLRSCAMKELSFGLHIEAPAADASGGARSLAPMLTLSVSSVTLSPGDSCTVVVSATLPPGTPDGEYVARIVIVDNSGTRGDETLPERRVPVRLRKGNVMADIKLGGFGAVRDGDEVRFSIDLQPLGNAVYHGNLHVEITGTAGKVSRKLHRLLDVYEPQRLVIPMKGGDIPPGRYKVFLNFVSDRLDLGDEAIPVLPKKYTVEINMP